MGDGATVSVGRFQGVSADEYSGFSENSPINILYCDLDFNITYANPKSIVTLEKLEQYLPVRTSEIVGSNIDIFHQNPQFQRNILRNPANLPHQAIIDVGPEKLDLLVSAVYDSKKEYIGAMVTWDIVTKKLDTEASMARMSSMMDNNPANIMYADRDLNIVYVNPKSIETLKTVEQYLPVSADNVVGSNIDIFHKKPEHQRNILKNDRNLPLSSDIQLGPERLNLLVSAIYDNSNTYIGTMVTWEVVTRKLIAEENLARTSSMMENSPSNIMFADRDFNITYLNPSSLKTLRMVEEHLPVPADKILGSSIDVFHKRPEHQRNLLKNDKNLPINTIIELGPEKLDLLVSAIYGEGGEYIGSMVTWDVVTEKLQMQEKMSQVQNMMENSPINVLFCDQDMNIQYVNPKSKETLATIEQYLPVRVEDVQGASIDIFHKDPKHQRKILSNPRNLPHKAIIDVGPEKLGLLASAIYDNNQKFIGVMLTWDVITKKLENELEMARMRNMIQNAPVNIVMANLEGQIVYMNPRSLETLKSLEKHLPRKVDEIVGESYDIFHSNPAHQRRILENERNLPHTAKIKLGNETLNLVVSAIKDNTGKYIGPMLTWEVISDKVALVDNLTKSANQLASAAEELNATANQMTANAEETSAQSGLVANNAKEISQGMETVATNTEEMTASIKEISRNANEASNRSNQTKTQAESTNTTISQLGESSQEIGNVITVINSIAQQTNLLALNATIEAARAGEAGKGFAVVANEVKELARQTATATQEITKKIAAIQKDAGGAVDAIGSISGSIDKLNDIAGSIAAAVEQQMATTTEVSRVVQESNSGVQTISENISGVSQAAENTSNAASQLVTAGQGLTTIAESMKELVSKIRI